jgi:hypothetical protein
MAIPVLPASSIFTQTGVKNGPAKDALNAVLTILSQHYDVSLPTIDALDATGKLTPSSANVQVNVYNNTPSANVLNTIDLTAVPDGRAIKISAANPLFPIVVVDSANGGAGGGEITIDPDGTVPSRVLDDVTKSLVIKRLGNLVYVASYTGFPPKGAITTPVATNIDFNGYGALGLSLIEKDITTATYNPTIDDRGWLLDAQVACAVVLPNPNDVSDPILTRRWKRGQTLYFFQQGPSLTFKQFDGSVPLNPFNHDRGYAPGALVVAKVYKIANTSPPILAWSVTGQTNSPTGGTTTGGGGGGGGGGGTPTDIIRSYTFYRVPTDYTTPADVSWHAAGTLSGFIPTASSKYFYLVSYGTKNTGSTAQNAALTRIVLAGSPDTELFHAGTDRYPQFNDRVMAGWGATYGASPSAVAVRIDAQDGSATYDTTISAMSFLALKLEATEDYANDAGTHTASTSTTYVDCCTLTLTSMPIGTYYFLCSMEFDTSAVTCRADMRVTVNGTQYTQYVASRNSLNPGIFFVIVPVTTTSIGTLTAKIQVKVNTGDTGSVSSNYASIVCLAKANFQKVLSDQDSAEISYPATAFTARLNDSWAFATGYNHLLLANCQASLDSSGSLSGLKVNWTMNGGNLVPDAVLGTRQDQYCAVSYGAMSIQKPTLAAEAIKLSFACINTANPEKSADCVMLALALDKF